MERECINFDLANVVEQARAQRATCNTPFKLFVDKKIAKELSELMKRPQWNRKFHEVLVSMMQNRRGRPDLYGYRKQYDVWVMKIKKDGLNSRLLCRENGKGNIVIMACIERHKTTMQPITKKNKPMYEAASKYIYNEMLQ